MQLHRSAGLSTLTFLLASSSITPASSSRSQRGTARLSASGTTLQYAAAMRRAEIRRCFGRRGHQSARQNQHVGNVGAVKWVISTPIARQNDDVTDGVSQPQTCSSARRGRSVHTGALRGAGPSRTARCAAARVAIKAARLAVHGQERGSGACQLGYGVGRACIVQPHHRSAAPRAQC